MRNFRNSEIFKRVVPFTLAAVVLAGTVLGLFGMIFAYAASERNNDVITLGRSNVTFYEYVVGQDRGPLVKSKNLQLNDETYDVYIVLAVNAQAVGVEPDNMDAGGVTEKITVRLEEPTEDGTEGGDFVTSRSGKFENLSFAGDRETDDKGRIFVTYRLRNVSIQSHKNGEARLGINVQYQTNEGGDPVSVSLWEKYRLSNVDTGGSSGSGIGDDDDDDDGGYRNNNPTSDDDDTEVLTTPKMIVTGFDIPPVVNPGEEFQVTVTFMNNSKKKDMENVSMTLTPSDGVAIKNGVNKRHYVKIPRRASTSETFTLKASKELKAEALNMTVKFDYQYEQDNAYKDGSSEEVLSILAIPKEEEEDTSGTEGSISSFEILSIVPPDSLYPNEDGYVTVKVINKDHQYDASNVQLTIVGEGLVNSGNTEYHGALTHSTQAEIEMAIQFTEPGAHTLQAIVTYEDSVGKDEKGKPKVRINDLTKDFTVTVQESPDMGMDMGMGDMMGIGGADMGGMEFDENGMPVGGEGMEAPWYQNPVILGCAGGGVLVVAVVAVLLIRRARKKKAGDDDEDL